MYDLRDPSCMKHAKGMPAGQALERLKEGNRRFLVSEKGSGDVSPSRRRETEELGQHPYAVVVTCSDSRVVPESIFSAGIGDLFVIRSAGNIVDGCTLGSIEYAVEHLGCNLVVVMGHTHCGAVAAALEGLDEGHVGLILDEVRAGIGEEKDPDRACILNIRHSMDVIGKDLPLEDGAVIVGALYDIGSGRVDFLRDRTS